MPDRAFGARAEDPIIDARARQSFPRELGSAVFGARPAESFARRMPRGGSDQVRATARSNAAVPRRRLEVDEPPLERLDSSAHFAASIAGAALARSSRTDGRIPARSTSSP